MVGVNWSSDPLTRVEALAPSPQQGKRGHFLSVDPDMKQLCDRAADVHVPSLRAILLLNLWAGLLIYAAVQGWLVN